MKFIVPNSSKTSLADVGLNFDEILALGAASWVLLGYLSGYFWRKENS